MVSGVGFEPTPTCVDQATDLYFNQRLTLANDLDPDSNFYSDLNSCDYLVENQFNDILNCKVRNKGYFSLLHLQSNQVFCSPQYCNIAVNIAMFMR